MSEIRVDLRWGPDTEHLGLGLLTGISALPLTLFAVSHLSTLL